MRKSSFLTWNSGVNDTITLKQLFSFIFVLVSDEELFEDNPEEYTRRDIEGSDVDTRRRAACDLVNTLSQHFEQRIMEIFGNYLQVDLWTALFKSKQFFLKLDYAVEI